MYARGCCCCKVVYIYLKLSDFVNKLNIVLNKCLLVLSNLFSFALKVSNSLSLLLDNLC
jgi:hypothetical protein